MVTRRTVTAKIAGSIPVQTATNWIGKYRICKFYRDYKVTTYDKEYFADEIYLVVFSLVKLANTTCVEASAQGLL